MIERACFRRAHRITSSKPGPPARQAGNASWSADDVADWV